MKHINAIVILLACVVFSQSLSLDQEDIQNIKSDTKNISSEKSGSFWGSEAAVTNSSDWGLGNLPVEPCDTKDATNQVDFAELMYLNMLPPCEETKTGHCGIRKYQNFTLVSKFATKNYNQQFRVRVHLVDKHFGFETALWPEFGACRQFFNITCPQEKGIVHSHIISEIPKEIPPLSTIIRVRLVSVNEKDERNIAICRQIKLHII